jgi:hypothetical protein
MALAQNTALVTEILVGVFTIVVGIAGAVKFLTKHYFDEIKSELKPNSGSSLKDQVTRLELKMSEAEEKRKETNKKIDHIYDVMIEYIATNK